jgi:hypothetical protein
MGEGRGGMKCSFLTKEVLLSSSGDQSQSHGTEIHLCLSRFHFYLGLERSPFFFTSSTVNCQRRGQTITKHQAARTTRLASDSASIESQTRNRTITTKTKQ